jgi:hypothetical protein
MKETNKELKFIIKNLKNLNEKIMIINGFKET